MTNATAGVRLGGSGYSYGDYALPSSKKPAPFDEDEESSGRKVQPQKRKGFLSDRESEVFLFTIKDPIKSVISKLMDLISTYGPEVIPVPIDISLAETGPLGYTSLFAFQPTLTGKKMEGLLKPVVK